MELNGYELSRNWFDWCFENPDSITPTHTAMYFFIIEHWNRLGRKEKFGFPMEMAKDALGIKNYKTFSKAFNDLIQWKFIVIHQKSKNQYSANVIALVKNTKANTKALTKASLKHTAKHLPKQVRGIVGIDKPKTNRSIKDISTPNRDFNFKKSLIELNVEEQIVNDWIAVRKSKKASNTATAFNAIKKQIELSGATASECIRIAAEKSWQGLRAEWVINEFKKQDNGNTGFTNMPNSGSCKPIFANDPAIFCGLEK